MQSRKHSLLESCANVAIGFLVALGAQLVMFPALGIPVSFHQNLLIGVIFTGVSLARSYCLRRLFNRASNARPVDRESNDCNNHGSGIRIGGPALVPNRRTGNYENCKSVVA